MIVGDPGVGRRQQVLQDRAQIGRVGDQTGRVRLGGGDDVGSVRVVVGRVPEPTEDQLRAGAEQRQRCPQLVARVGHEPALQGEGVSHRSDGAPGQPGGAGHRDRQSDPAGQGDAPQQSDQLAPLLAQVVDGLHGVVAVPHRAYRIAPAADGDGALVGDPARGHRGHHRSVRQPGRHVGRDPVAVRIGDGDVHRPELRPVVAVPVGCPAAVAHRDGVVEQADRLRLLCSEHGQHGDRRHDRQAAEQQHTDMQPQPARRPAQQLPVVDRHPSPGAHGVPSWYPMPRTVRTMPRPSLRRR